jgi:serine/threonine-protein kinase
MAKDTLALVGQTIDNVRFDAIVDEGGFGYVYRGRHLGLDEPVAIKCLKILGPSAEELGGFEARFRDETKILYRLSQGNLDICRSISSGTLKTRNGVQVPYMVLEWLEGRTLSSEIKTRRASGRAAFTLAEAMALLDSAAGALRHAHTEGVVHRDIKPTNLFIADTRDGRRVKVLDFGLAKIVDPEGFMRPESSPTAAHVFVCSPAYGAPEQFSKDIGAIGAWTDVYSFTLVLLELLSGQRVRDARTLIEGMLKAIDPRFCSPTARSLGVHVSDAVEKVLARSVALEPHERWKDVGAMWDALRAAVASSESAKTMHDEVPAGAREDVMRRVEAFRASVVPGKGGKGGTVGMNVPPPRGRDARVDGADAGRAAKTSGVRLARGERGAHASARLEAAADASERARWIARHDDATPRRAERKCEREGKRERKRERIRERRCRRIRGGRRDSDLEHMEARPHRCDRDRRLRWCIRNHSRLSALIRTRLLASANDPLRDDCHSGNAPRPQSHGSDKVS